MKILFPYNTFVGGFLQSIIDAVDQLGHAYTITKQYEPALNNRILNRIDSLGYLGIKEKIRIQRQEEYNDLLITTSRKNKPDVFFNFSGGEYLPKTIKTLKNDLGILTMCYIADNPCDPRRDKYLAMSLQHYDVLLYAEDIWIKILNNIAPKSKKIKFLGGYDPKLFFPENLNDIEQDKLEKLQYDIVFTGGSYQETGEGAYRAGILGQLAEQGYDVQIWGDIGWKFREQFYPELVSRINTQRLPYKDFRVLFQASKIYLNMPSPQIFSSFQPRVFEIAAAKGFQIIDHSDALYDVFGDDFVSFKSYQELTKKIDYYLKNTEERKEFAKKMHTKVSGNYTWEKQIDKVLAEI